MPQFKIIIEYSHDVTQNDVNYLLGLGVMVRGTSVYQPSIIHAAATREQLSQIAGLPNVLRVHSSEDVSTQIAADADSRTSGIITRGMARHMINADMANDRGFTGRGVRVAVLDTGVRSTNAFLQGHVVGAIQVADGNLEDAYGHGTHVAGIIVNIAPDAQILNVKVMNDNGQGDFSTVMIGMEKAADAGAQVMNMSFATPVTMCLDGHPLSNLMRTLSYQKKIIFVCAAGNTPNAPGFPGIDDGTIAVGAVDLMDNIADFSSRGPSPCNRVFPDISAPGVNVLSAYLDGDRIMSGTSMASPHVAGVMAILLQRTGQGMTRQQLEPVLSISGHGLMIQKTNVYGWGVIDANATLDAPVPVQMAKQSNGGLLFFLAGLSALPFLLNMRSGKRSA